MADGNEGNENGLLNRDEQQPTLRPQLLPGRHGTAVKKKWAHGGTKGSDDPARSETVRVTMTHGHPQQRPKCKAYTHTSPGDKPLT